MVFPPEAVCGFKSLRKNMKNLNLPVSLTLYRLTYETNGVHIFNFAARAQRITGLADRYVYVSTHAAFLHITIARPYIAQNRTQFSDI